MAKKHKQKWMHYKPHPHILHSRRVPPFDNCSSSTSSSVSISTPAVNELLSHLRATQSRNDDSTARCIIAQSTLPSVPPDLQLLLNNRFVLYPPIQPRSRSNGVFTGTQFWRTAGPPPPASWLLPPESPQSHQPLPPPTARIPDTGHCLPGIPIPPPSSLQHYALTKVAQNIDFHVYYDQHFLPTLPSRLKAALLSYIANCSSARVSAAIVRALFPVEGHVEGEEEEEEITTHLDFSGILEDAGPKVLCGLLRNDEKLSSQIGDQGWEEGGSRRSRLRFPALTHLSLANTHSEEVRRQYSMGRLLGFAELTPQLTHLSIAGWWGITGVTLRRLARELLCLKWLDVSDCGEEVGKGLMEEDMETVWVSGWRLVETVVARRVVGAEGLSEMVRGDRKSVV